MAWFKKTRCPIAAQQTSGRVPEGMWVKCPGCDQTLYERGLAEGCRVCTKCGHHLRMTATQRLESLLDDATSTEHDSQLRSNDPHTKSYQDRLKAGETVTGLADAAIEPDAVQ